MHCLSSLLVTAKDATTLLIDADLYLYRAAVNAEMEIDWGDDIWSLRTDLKVAKKLFTEEIESFCAILDADDVLLCVSDTANFRKTVYPAYKSNRKKNRKPVGYKALVDWAKNNWPSHVQATLEADDILGILGSNDTLDTIVVSDDKDLMTIPCRLFKPRDGSLSAISKAVADKNFLLQTLVGDSTDGYPGLKGAGPVRAEKILGKRPDFSLVVRAYEGAGSTRVDALTQARCARILRHSDWNEERQKIELWEPSQ